MTHLYQNGEIDAIKFLGELRQKPKSDWAKAVISKHQEMMKSNDPNHYRPKEWHDGFLAKSKVLLRQNGAN